MFVVHPASYVQLVRTMSTLSPTLSHDASQVGSGTFAGIPIFVSDMVPAVAPVPNCRQRRELKKRQKREQARQSAQEHEWMERLRRIAALLDDMMRGSK